MHDATEAYLGDMPHPLKHRSPLGAAFKDAEDRLEDALRERVRRSSRTCRRSSAPTARCWPPSAVPSAARRWHWPELEGVEPLDMDLRAWPPDEAERVFAERYAELDARR